MSEAWRVRLDVFDGPMDLLLHLVRKQEVPVAQLRISAITDQYIAYLEMLRKLEIEPAGEFLVLAATLMEIKSEALIPVPEKPATAEVDPGDPRGELVRQLLAYKEFKDAADRLERTGTVFAGRHGRPLQKLPEGPEDAEADVGQLSVWDLLKAFVRILEDTGAKAAAIHEVDYQDTPIEVHAERVKARLEAEGPLSLSVLLVGIRGRGEIIGLFIALLELAKQRIILIEQPDIFGDIRVRLRPVGERGHAAFEASQAAAEAGPGFAPPTTGEGTATGPDGPEAGRDVGAAGGDGVAPATGDGAGGGDGASTAGADVGRGAAKDGDPVAAVADDDGPAVSEVDDWVDPDLLDDEVTGIEVPDLDLSGGRRKRPPKKKRPPARDADAGAK